MSEAAYTCRAIVETITEYLDGGLQPAERVAFERHVVICPPCRAYLAQIRTVTRVAKGLREDELSQEARDGLLDAFAKWREGRSSS